MPIRRAVLASLAVTVALVVCAPTAGASPFPGSTIPTSFGGAPAAGLAFPDAGGTVAGPCGRPIGAEGEGSTGEVTNQACLGAGLSFIGPSTGQIATVIGPTIIGPAVVGVSIVSAGDSSVGGY
jgi:hypothetical protein